MCFSHVWLYATLWTVTRQALLSMGFSRQEYWSALPCPPPGDLPDPGMKPTSLASPALADSFFSISTTWETIYIHTHITYTHTHTDTYISTYIHMHICMYIHTYMYPETENMCKTALSPLSRVFQYVALETHAYIPIPTRDRHTSSDTSWVYHHTQKPLLALKLFCPGDAYIRFDWEIPNFGNNCIKWLYKVVH